MWGVMVPGCGDHLAALYLFAADAAQQHADVVAGLALVQDLSEHLHPGADRLAGLFGHAHYLHLVADVDLARAPPCRWPPCPCPVMEKTSSTGIRNGLSMSRAGVGM